MCSENSVANDCILTAPNFAQPFLLEMKSLFKKQMQQLPFWVISKRMLSDVGKLAMRLEFAFTHTITMPIINTKDKQMAKKKARKEAKKSRKNNRKK